MKKILFTILIIFVFSSHAQIGGKLPLIKRGGGDVGILSDTLKTKKRTKKSEVVYPISYYKKFSIHNDSVQVDTLLSIRNFYRVNYTLKDDFELIPFQNLGQGFNYLSASFLDSDVRLLPGFVAAQKEFNRWTEEDIPFFYVPTAYSNLFYLNGITQGQMLKAFITTNITPQLNFTVGYKGLTSLGLYKNSLTSLGRFFINSNYRSKNKKYSYKVFYMSHDLLNQENGGLKEVSQFESGDPAFSNRSRIEVKFDDAEMKTYTTQFYLDQSYTITNNNNLSIRNKLNFINRKYIYTQTSPSSFIGEAFTTGKIIDSTRLKQFEDDILLKFEYKKIQLETGLGYVYNHYQWDSIKHINNQLIPAELLYKDMKWTSLAQWNTKKMNFRVESEIIPTKNLQSYKINAFATYHLDSIKGINLFLLTTSHRPDLKYILFQSAYKKLNWYHPEFDNVHYQTLRAQLSHKNLGKLSFKQQALNNYTYFGQDSIPHQYRGLISISSIKFENDIRYKKIGLSSDVLYQKVLKGKQVFSLPSFVVRESIYYTDRFFKKHLQLQTGFTFKYFTSFYALGYHPVLGDYFVQREQEIGDFPLLDFFFNFKVKRFRFYFKAEHFNALWEKKEPIYYASPEFPMRDFSLRFGINWIFFN